MKKSKHKRASYYCWNRIASFGAQGFSPILGVIWLRYHFETEIKLNSILNGVFAVILILYPFLRKQYNHSLSSVSTAPFLSLLSYPNIIQSQKSDRQLLKCVFYDRRLDFILHKLVQSGWFVPVKNPNYKDDRKQKLDPTFMTCCCQSGKGCLWKLQQEADLDFTIVGERCAGSKHLLFICRTISYLKIGLCTGLTAQTHPLKTHKTTFHLLL